MAILSSNPTKDQSNLYGYFLPKGLIKLTLTGTGTQIATIEMTPEIVADRSERLYLQYSPSWFSKDTLDVTFTPEGFLKQVSTVRDDKTIEVIKAVIESVSTFVEGAEPRDGVRGGPVAEPFTFTETFDPFDKKQVDKLNQDLGKIKAKFSITGIAGEKIVAEKPNDNKDGIWCRPTSAFKCYLEHGGDKKTQSILKLPDPGQLQYVEIPSARFVTSTFIMDFDDQGFPSKIHIDKPSEALAVAQLPLTIAGAILDLPARLFQLRVNIDKRKEEEAEYWKQKAEKQEKQEKGKKEGEDSTKTTSKTATQTSSLPPEEPI